MRKLIQIVSEIWQMSILLRTSYSPAGIYLFKLNYRNTRTRCEICSNFTKTPEQRQCLYVKWNHSDVFLKLVSAIFYQILIFHQMIALQKLRKMFFISSKKLFSFLRYLNFCILVFLSFFSLSATALEFDARKILKSMMSSTV